MIDNRRRALLPLFGLLALAAPPASAQRAETRIDAPEIRDSGTVDRTGGVKRGGSASALAPTPIPGGLTSPVPLATLYADRPSLRYFATAAHPLHLDGLADDAPVIQASIDYYCAQPNGGNIQVPNGTYAIATPLVQACSNVHLVGPGTGSVGQNVGTVNNYSGAYFKWIGASGGTIMQVAPVAATSWPSTTQFLTNADVSGITFDCNAGLASTGLDVRSTRGAQLRGASLGCSAYGLRLDTVPLGDTNDIQYNDVWWEFNHIAGGGIGVFCGATATMVDPAEEHGNCSSNTFHHIYGYLGGKPGLVFGYSDHNVAKGHITCIQNGKATCVLFNGSTANKNDVAYANHLDSVSGGAVVAQGTDQAGIVGPARYNAVKQLDPADGGVFLSGPGTASIYETDAGNFFGARGFGTDAPAFPGIDVTQESRIASAHVGDGSSDAFLYPDGANGLDIRVGTAAAYTYLRLNAAGQLTVPTLSTTTATAPNGVFGGTLVIPFGTPASSATPVCLRGQIEQDANYIYSCPTAGTWRRTAQGSKF